MKFGIDPVKLFDDMRKSDNRVRFVMEFGIDPVKLFNDKSK